MNTILFFLVLLGVNRSGIDNCREKYTEFIINKGFGEHSYYLNVLIRDDSAKEFDIVVTNYELYLILKNEQGITKEKYIEIVKRNILNDKPVSLLKPIAYYGTHTFLICKKDKKVNKIAKHGENYFIRYYLGERSLNEFKEKEDFNLAAVIKQLIFWNIPVKLGDNDGGFFVDIASFKCASKKG